MSEWHVLDNPVRASLLGPHSRLSVSHGGAVRYRPDVSVFVALPDEPDDGAWRDVADLLGPGAVAPIAGLPVPPPPGWEIVSDIEGVQLVDDGVAAESPRLSLRLSPIAALVRVHIPCWAARRVAPITPTGPERGQEPLAGEETPQCRDAAGRVFADDHTAGGEDLVEQVLVREQNADEKPVGVVPGEARVRSCRRRSSPRTPRSSGCGGWRSSPTPGWPSWAWTDCWMSCWTRSAG